MPHRSEVRGQHRIGRERGRREHFSFKNLQSSCELNERLNGRLKERRGWWKMYNALS